MTTKTLDKLRKEIDAVDDAILDLLNQRAQWALEVGKAKAGGAQDFYVPARERAIFERLSAANRGPFPQEGIRRVWREIISASLALEHPMKVVFLGPQATNTHVAAMRQFGYSAQLIPEKSVSAVFEDVSRGRADFGVVPVENSTEGVVAHTLDMFMVTDLVINAEIKLAISHDLLSLSGRLEEITRVVSHPQALAQCRHWLEENLPDIPLVDVASTARAAQMAAEDGSVAAVASEMAATLYGVQVVKHKIEDNPNNFTRFLVIGKKSPPRTGHDKTSVMFSVRDEPGILYKMLEPFNRRDINLSKIESRPMKSKAWEYIFFLDIDGHIEEENVRAAIEDLKGYCQLFKILGSYQKADQEKEMRSFFPLLTGWLLLLSTAAWADSVVELLILQEFFSQKGMESRSTRLTGAALEEFSRRPMVGEFLPDQATVEFRLLVENEKTAIYEAVVSRDGLAEMWSAFFQRGLLGSKLEAIKSLNIPPYLAGVEYQRLLAQKRRSATQEARLVQLQRLFMTTAAFKEYFNQNRSIYETIALLVETGKVEEAEAASKAAALVGVRLYGESKSEGEMALLDSTAGSKGKVESNQLGSEVRVSGFLDSFLGLLHLPTGVSPPLMSAQNYIFVEALDENWYLFRNLAAEPLKEKSSKNE